MSTAIEAGVGDVWQVKQATLGTIEPIVTTTTKHLRKVGDDALKSNKTYGSEEWVDGKQFGSPGMYVDTVGGDVGSLTFQVQPETGGFAFAQILAVDIVTGAPSDYTHTITSGTANGPLQTIRQKVGATVINRQAFWDAKISKLTFNCGQDQKVAHIQEDVFALKAAAWYTTDPAMTDSGTDPFLWTEGTGSFTIDAVAYSDVDGETLEIDRKIDVHRGDSVAPSAFISNKGEIMRSFSAIVTDATLPVFKSVLYATTSPTDGLAVSGTVNYVALESLYTRTAVRSLKITTPRVAVDPNDFEVGPHAEGGATPITFGGRCLESGGSPIITVVAKTGDAAAYA